MRQLKITKSITNRESDSLDKYLQEIGHEELISVEEEVELAQRIKKGDRKALEKLTKANLRFVVSVAKQYQNQGLTLPDLSLIEANEAFASQSIACAKVGGWASCMEKVNVNGGAIALGHPVGASGARILTTLLYELKRRGGGKGLATLCVGGGMGVAAVVEAL